jgi:hypothetical protein
VRFRENATLRLTKVGKEPYYQGLYVTLTQAAEIIKKFTVQFRMRMRAMQRSDSLTGTGMLAVL